MIPLRIHCYDNPTDNSNSLSSIVKLILFIEGNLLYVYKIENHKSVKIILRILPSYREGCTALAGHALPNDGISGPSAGGISKKAKVPATN